MKLLDSSFGDFLSLQGNLGDGREISLLFAGKGMALPFLTEFIVLLLLLGANIRGWTLQCHDWSSCGSSCNFLYSNCCDIFSMILSLMFTIIDDSIWYVASCSTRLADAFWIAIGRAISTGAQGIARVVLSGTWP